MGDGLSWSRQAPPEALERAAAARATGPDRVIVGDAASGVTLDVDWEPGQSRTELRFQLLPLFDAWIDQIVRVSDGPDAAVATGVVTRA